MGVQITGLNPAAAFQSSTAFTDTGAGGAIDGDISQVIVWPHPDVPSRYACTHTDMQAYPFWRYVETNAIG